MCGKRWNAEYFQRDSFIHSFEKVSVCLAQALCPAAGDKTVSQLTVTVPELPAGKVRVREGLLYSLL